MQTFNDPDIQRQTYLGPTGLNALPLYPEYTGKGVRVGVVDSGVTWDDPDLVGRVDTENGWDTVTQTNYAYATPTESPHGTNISKYIAATPNNDVGGVGVAWGATIVPFKMADDSIRTPEMELDALSRQWQVDISNNSWGVAPFLDNFLTVYQQQGAAIAYAATVGRDGLGTIWIRSGGNTVDKGDDVSLRNYANNRFTMTVGTSDLAGENVSPDSTRGAALWTIGPAPGTSWAGGMLSGVVALMLEANPGLGYRDVQTIIAVSGRELGAADPWVTSDAPGLVNGGGVRHSRASGFGMFDATAAVRLAETWDTEPRTEANIVHGSGTGTGFAITDFSNQTSTITIDQALLVEHAVVTFDLGHSEIGDLRATLISPNGTESILFERMALGDYGKPVDTRFEASSAQFFWEQGQGTWTLRIEDLATGETGILRNWTLDLYGAPDIADDLYIYNNGFAITGAADPARRVLADPDGGIDTVNIAAVAASNILDLTPGGSASRIAGVQVTVDAGSIFEKAFAGDGDDTLIGNLADNTLFGGRANDLLQGAAGNDSLDGWRGVDTAAGGTGDDLYVVDEAGDLVVEAAGEGRDTVHASLSWTLGDGLEDLVLEDAAGAATGTGNALGNLLTGNASANTLAGDAGADTLLGEAGDDSLLGGVEGDSLAGGEGTDTLAGGDGDDLYAMDGDADLVVEAAGEGNDTIVAATDFTLAGGPSVEGLTLLGSAVAGTGNALDNTVLGNAAANSLAGQGGADTIAGGEGADTLLGGAGHDSLSGEGGADSLAGGEGSDSLEGGDGPGTLAGGTGNDAYFVDEPTESVIEAVGEGDDTVFAAGDHVLAAGQSLETLVLLEGAGAGTGNDLANRILGHAGANSLAGAGGSDTLEGAEGADTLAGGAGPDLLAGGGDNDLYLVGDAADAVQEAAGGGSDTVQASVDYVLAAGQEVEALALLAGVQSGTGNELANTILGNGLANLLSGGDGADTLSGAGGADTLAGGGDADSLDGAADADSLDGGAGDDTLSGAAGADRLAGGDGADSLNGGAGADTATGGTGDDAYAVDNAADQVTEAAGGGNDTVRASVDYVLGAGQAIEALELVGTALAGQGNAAANALTGNAGANTLSGEDGADTLTGGAGNDSLVGGAGTDIAVFTGENADYLVVALAGGALQVTDLRTGGPDGSDTVSGVEVFRFADGEVSAAVLLGGTGATAGPDSLRGAAGLDTIDGLAGNDTLTGLSGNDRLVGGVGQDSLAGGRGRDTLLGVGGADTLAGDDDADSLNGGGDADLLLGDRGSDTLQGTAGNDTLDGGLDADGLVGGAGNDLLLVDNAGDRAIEAAGGGADTVEASVDYVLAEGEEIERLVLLGSALTGTGNGFGNAVLGQAGANTLAGAAGNDTLEGAEGADRLDGGAGSDGLQGGEGTDTLSGGSEADSLSGGTEDDSLEGGAGADTMAGGSGNDAFLVDSSLDQVLEAAGEGADTVTATVSFALGAGQEVESLVLLGAAVAGTGNGVANSILGNAQANVIEGAEGDDTLSGAGAADTIDGGTGADSLDGGTGADSLAGGAGDDAYAVDEALDAVAEAAGGGNDTVHAAVSYALAAGQEIEALVLGGAATQASGNAFANAITGNELANTLAGGDGADTLTGGLGNDSLAGEAANDSLVGGDGSDTLDGGAGADALSGGAGDDRYLVNAAGDSVAEAEGEGNDTVLASVTWTLGTGIETLILTGAAAIDGTGNGLANAITGNGAANALAGLDGDDTLAGEAGTDTLLGGAGTDSLDGGAGADSMAGGAGDDAYAVDDAADAVAEAAGGGADTVFSSVAWALGADLEHLVLTGAANIAGTGNALANAITGNAGNNALSGLDGDDTLAGGAGKDTLAGAAGNDSLDGGAGADSLSGGTGNDAYAVDDALDVVSETGGGGNDTVFASVTWTLGSQLEALTLTGTGAIDGTGNGVSNLITGNDAANALSGGDGNDTLLGALGADTLSGGASNDSLDGGVGPDSMAGGGGNDTYVVDDAGDVVSEAGGGGLDTVRAAIDWVLGEGVEILTLIGTADINGRGDITNNTITGNAGNNRLEGGNGADGLFGEGGADTLIGDEFGDRLNGGEGGDSLAGGDGADTLDGGLGDDTINLETADDVIVEAAGAGYDTAIADFTATLAGNVEKLVLIGEEDIGGTGNGLDNVLVGTVFANSFSGAGGNDTILADAGRDTLLGEDGNDLLDASLGNDSLDGGAGSDTALGDVGDDTLSGGTGSDSLVGGVDDDLYLIDGLFDTILEAIGEGSDTISASVDYALGVGLSIEGLFLTGAALTGTGNELANTVVGNAGANTLSGGGADDTLEGGAGNDSLLGGAGSDDAVFAGTTGEYDVVDLGGGAWRVTDLRAGAPDGSDTIAGIEILRFADADVALADFAGAPAATAGADSLRGTLVPDTIAGLGGNDTIAGLLGADRLSGQDGDDSLLGGGANDTLIGADGADRLDGSEGADRMEGGAGDDGYVVDSLSDLVIEAVAGGADTISATLDYVLGAGLAVESLVLLDGAVNGTGNELDNTLTGNAADNLLAGGDGADSLAAGEGADTVQGGAGSDTVDGGLGTDSMAGGAGDDLYIVDDVILPFLLEDVADTVFEAAGEGNDTILAFGTWTLGEDFEALLLDGSGRIDGTGNALDNTISGTDGGNQLSGLEGEDSLFGGSNNDTLIGGDGDDTLDGDIAADRLEGGLGNDYYRVDFSLDAVVELPGEGSDTIEASIGWTLGDDFEALFLTRNGDADGTGNAADNTITGTIGVNELRGLDGDDSLFGANAPDRLFGDVGDDTLDGGQGRDTLNGGTGNDVYIVDDPLDAVVEQAGAGLDEVRSAVTWTLGSNLESLVLTGTGTIGGVGNTLNNSLVGNGAANQLSGGGGLDSVAGGGGADTLLGGTGNDTLLGEAGDDNLDGGAGADSLVGGAGLDAFRFSAPSEGTDTIADFTKDQDAIWISSLGFGGTLPLGALGAGSITFGAVAVGAGPKLVYDAATGDLSWDADGGGGAAALRFANLVTKPVLDLDDFTVVA